MTAPEIRKLAEDYLALPPGPYEAVQTSPTTDKYWIVIGSDNDELQYFEGSNVDAEAEARRLNAMPGLLKAAIDEWTEELEALVARCEAHQRGEAHDRR